MTTPLTHLFTPLTINSLRLRNRINMAPMVTNYATARGEITDRAIAYYAARAHGGAGLITLEATVVSPEGRSFTHNICLHDDLYVPGLRRLADAVHAGGGAISVELYHAGRRTTAAIARYHPVGPSPIPAKGGEVPWELSEADIARVVRDFAEAARRGQEAGCDAVTVHAAHGYLIASFLSPHSNKRRDAYGGTLLNRARFGLEVIEAVRVAVGTDYPVLCRLTGSEYLEDGFQLAEARQVAQWYEAAGVDAFDISAGAIETAYMANPYMMFPRGLLVPLAAGVKEVVSVPVFAVGRINDPLLAEKVLAEGSADAITLGRALIADPEFPNKAREGRLGDIRPCIACNQGCIDRLQPQLDVACLANPEAGREQYLALFPAPKPKNVLVVGGGLAGMEAAWVARQRGHAVELHERADRLGGQFRLAAAAPGKDEALNLVEFLERQVRQSGVAVHLGSELSEAELDRRAPDAVVVATGARPATLPLPGIERCLSAWEVLAGKVTAGQRVVVIGGGQVGCETAEYLADQGRSVTILELLPEVAGDMGLRTREPFVQQLIALGVDIITKAMVTSVGEREVAFDRAGLPEKLIDVDGVVLAIGSTADGSLARALTGKTYQVIAVGDCVKARRGLEAIHEGYAAGNAV